LHALGAFQDFFSAETNRIHINLKYPCKASDGTVAYWTGLQVARDSPELWMKLMKLMTDSSPFPEVGVFVKGGQTVGTPLDEPITGENGIPLRVVFFPKRGVRWFGEASRALTSPPSTYEVGNVF